MATLTETAYQVRRGVKMGGIISLAVLILWFVGGAAINLYKKMNPDPLPPPTVDFGKLQSITFPKENGRPEVSLELPTGAIPAFPDRMYVFFAPTKRSGFLDPQKAIDTASALGFIFKPEQPSETRYVWRQQDQLNSTLDMDIISGQFSLTRSWQNNPALLSVTNFVSDQQVSLQLVNYLQRVGLMPDDMKDVHKITYLKAEGNKLVPALSLSDAQFIQVDMFRDDFAVTPAVDPNNKNAKITDDQKIKYAFYRPNPDKGLVSAVVSGSQDSLQQYVSINYAYTKIEYDTRGTYPIKTGQQAWEDLKAGKGYVTDKSQKTGNVKIRRILLGYYDTEANHKYTMPIYIFLGDKNFTAYVSAVTDEYLSN